MNQPGGFTYKVNKDNTVIVTHRGKNAAALRKQDAVDFLDEIVGLRDEDAQQVMARLTGNYKRGNERLAKSHPRNQS